MRFKPFPKIVDFDCRLTAYYPPPPGGYASEAEASLEGGDTDRLGHPLCTLQDYLEGRASYVSVAMDRSVSYGTYLRIPALDKHFASDRPIEFRVVDTGGAFRGQGLRRMDICVREDRDPANGSEVNDRFLNQVHRVYMIVQSEPVLKA